MASKFSFDVVRQNIAKMKKDLPRYMANDAQNFFLGSFASESWQGSGRWAEVKRRMGPGTTGGGDKGTPEWCYPKNKKLSRRENKILVGTGRLRQAVANSAGQSKVAYKSYDFTVTMTVDKNVVPYAAFQNDGTDHIPQRQFFGDNPALRSRLVKRIKAYMDKTWK